MKANVIGSLSPLFLFLTREYTKDIFANPRELNQAVTFLHENGESVPYSTEVFYFNATLVLNLFLPRHHAALCHTRSQPPVFCGPTVAV